MSSPLLALLLAAAPLSSESIPTNTPVHLGISLALTHDKELDALRRGLQDPASPQFRRWLTPAEFGERFGQPREVIAAITTELSRAGLEVTVAPSRAFLEARGTAGQVEHLLGAQLAPVAGSGPNVHQLVGELNLPASFAPVINISGLDTRLRFKRRISIGNGNALGPQDLRRFYGVDPLHNQGFVGQGQQLAVLSTALPAGSDVNLTAINYFFTNISNVSAPLVKRIIPNPQHDVDNQPGGAGEFELDVEMQSVGSPGADSITLVVSPASEVFATGANDIANNLPNVTAVSVSLGTCEPTEQQLGASEINALRNAIIQGVTEGQTWSAASGDNGADDCQRGNGLATVDFPSSIPEFVAVGGSSIPSPAWDTNHALAAWQPEVTWNGGTQGGAAGGGISAIFARPAYQQGLTLSGTGRSVPDISLIAGLPGVAVSSATAIGALDPAEGTSVASPLSAGFFALIASKVGCRLGDVHATLYALGAAQADGGTAVFHDLTSGNLTFGPVVGPAAGPGFDSATGWGTLDVAALAAAWPACPPLPDGGTVDTDAGLLVSYTACGTLACDGGCQTLPEGPSTCAAPCNPNASSCPVGTVCSTDTLFATGGNGSCVPGCTSAADCVAQPGTVCSTCDQVCVAAGSATAKIGDACTADTQCPSGAYCAGRPFTNGYCTLDCVVGASSTSACACPAASHCGQVGGGGTAICLETCTGVGSSCGRAGYLCQPQTTGGASSCLPTCRVLSFGGQMFDTCSFMGTNKACDVASGICGGPVPDAGTPDAGQPDAGRPDAGINPVDAGAPDAGSITPDAGGVVTLPPVPTDLGKANGGCGCNSDGTSAAPMLLFGLVWLRRLRATRRS